MFNSFKRIKTEHKFEVLDQGSTTFKSEHHYLLEARESTRFFFRQYFWTGTDLSDETAILKSAIDQWGHPLHRLHGPIIRESKSRIVVVDLGRTLEPGHKEEISFRHSLRDLEGTFEPRFSYSSKPNDGALSIKVLLPSSFERPCFHIEAADTESCLETEVLTPIVLPNNAHQYERTIEQVEQNRRYIIAWKK